LRKHSTEAFCAESVATFGDVTGKTSCEGVIFVANGTFGRRKKHFSGREIFEKKELKINKKRKCNKIDVM